MAKIVKIKCIRTRKDMSWTIVKVYTDQDGLYGIGSASDLYNGEAVIKVVENLLAPLLIGKDSRNIEDLWQTMYTSGYWRNGSILQTAIGGIDMALWDIKGKEAGKPVYELLGGASRAAVPCYAHANGVDQSMLEEQVQNFIDEGYTVIRCQLGGYGGGGFISNDRANLPDNTWTKGSVFNETVYINSVTKMFENLRIIFGEDIEFTHDVHEHVSPIAAIKLAKQLEPYNLFFLEDALPPEQIGWFRHLRSQCSTPMAIGELFVHPHEYTDLISERLIDFIRTRISKVGGITAGRKIAILSEFYGVRTAWQEGGENDPVNQAAAVHLDMAIHNFGIQEINHFSNEELQVFPGHIVRKGGYLYVNDAPGLGIDIDEERAELLVDDEWKSKTYYRPYKLDRKADGTLVRP